MSILQVREEKPALDHRADITEPNLRLTSEEGEEYNIFMEPMYIL
jgi:hypothetical protein